jgi:hypothetical protein
MDRSERNKGGRSNFAVRPVVRKRFWPRRLGGPVRPPSGASRTVRNLENAAIRGVRNSSVTGHGLGVERRLQTDPSSSVCCLRNEVESPEIFVGLDEERHGDGDNENEADLEDEEEESCQTGQPRESASESVQAHESSDDSEPRISASVPRTWEAPVHSKSCGTPCTAPSGDSRNTERTIERASLDVRMILEENLKALSDRGMTRRGRPTNIFPDSRDIRVRERSARRKLTSEARTSRRVGTMRNTDNDEDSSDSEEGLDLQSIPNQWFSYLRGLPKSFCDPENLESSMRGRRERLLRGEVSYRGLGISHLNNEDIKFIFSHMYESKAVRGQSLASYEQLRACAGQYARFAVVCGLIPLARLCDAGFLFNAVLSMDTIKAFLTYFQLRCSASTVLSKAFHLRTVSRFAERYFTCVISSEQNRSRAELLSQYLTSACSTEKYESRRGTARMRSEERRISCGKLLVGADFQRFGALAEKRLNQIMASGAAAVRRVPGLISKWCINFVGILVFYGAGQRPQVYAQLQEPEDIVETIRRWTADKRITLAPLLEKRPRQTGYSKVSFPIRTLDLFAFHLQVVKPAIQAGIASETETERRARWQRERDEDVENPILLHTKTAEAYTAYQVRTTLQRFVMSIDTELEHVTPSVVRSSFATWQYQLFKHGDLFSGKSEEEFMDMLSKVMNTSPEQLKSTYIACSQMDAPYDRVMQEVHGVFDRLYEDLDEPDDDLDGEE